MTAGPGGGIRPEDFLASSSRVLTPKQLLERNGKAVGAAEREQLGQDIPRLWTRPTVNRLRRLPGSAESRTA